MNNVAQFTYLGSDGSKSRLVKFYRNAQGLYVCDIEGYPALKIIHPSKERVKAAFLGYWEMSWKDWGASEITWNGME